ncbi:ROK family protein [Catenulispora rubra]|uniref:ROK family protein n=1 Tax=Catenulispora rubra TaxID=280293 RepID=UPI00189252C9|nr:ROK family protein [Catenulispora rubra]
MICTRAAGSAGAGSAWIPALDIGGTHVTAGLVDLAERQVRIAEGWRRPLSPDGSADDIVDAVVAAALATGAGPGRHWAVAVPGPFDYEAGIALFHGVGKFEALHGFDLRAALTSALPEPASVTFVNDADAFLLGEYTAGAALRHERAVGITLGSGVGSCFLAGGKVVADGPDVPPQGRMDLLTHDGRPLEDTVSRRAIRAAYADVTGSPGGPSQPDVKDLDVKGPDVKEIAERARAADAAAQQVLDHAMTALGLAVAPWLARFQATVLVVGGSLIGSWDLLARPLQAGIALAEPAVAWRLGVVRALMPLQAPLLGAAVGAEQAWKSKD